MSCVVCNDPKVQRHHVFPKRWFGNGVRVPLCKHHHRKIENDIFNLETSNNMHSRKKLDRQVYFDLVIELTRK